MADPDHNTTTPSFQRLDAGFQAYADVLRVNDGDDETNAVAAYILSDVVDRIQPLSLRTLGDLRQRARALLEWYDLCGLSQETGLIELLKALDALPPRRWGEPIR